MELIEPEVYSTFLGKIQLKIEKFVEEFQRASNQGDSLKLFNPLKQLLLLYSELLRVIAEKQIQ